MIDIKRSISKYIIGFFVLIIPIFLNAQVFWQEDFSDGFPENWFSQDLSVNNTRWTWCGNPLQGQTGGCPAIWDTEVEAQTPFQSETADNGFMSFDSDRWGVLNQNHVATLTSAPIDCSDKEEVYLEFQSHIGIFRNPAMDNAFVRVSTNQVSWTGFIPFTDLSGIQPDRWSDNPTLSLFDISEIAAGSSTVYLQWYWEGNFEFFWNIDDVKLYDVDPTLLNDMRVNENFYALPPYAQVPIKQACPIRFLADIQNVGQNTQTNVNLNISIRDLNSNMIVHTQDLNFGTVVRDSLVENIPFPDTYTPDAKGFYEGVYTVSSDSLDEDMSNNQQVFSFSVTDSVFAKSFGNAPFANRPTNTAWDLNEPHSWGYGLHYQIPNGDGVYANSVSFGIGNPEEANNTTVTAWLYEWTDINDNGDCEEPERTPIGVGTYQITGAESPISLVKVDLDNFEGDGPIFLEDSEEYIVMIQYAAPDDLTNLEILTDRLLDYNAQYFISDSLDENPKYHDFIYVGEPETFEHIGFFLSHTPDIRLNLGGDLTINTIDLDGFVTELKYFPNPVMDVLNLGLEFSESISDLSLSIIDLNGNVLREKKYPNTSKLSTRFDTNDLISGAYLIRVVCNKGSFVQKFVVVDE